MLEITFSDLFLLIWAGVATGFAVYYKHHALMRHRLIIAIVTEEGIYTEIKERFNQAKEQYDRQN